MYTFENIIGDEYQKGEPDCFMFGEICPAALV